MASNPQTAVTVVEQTAPVVFNLDEFPEANYNRLIPTQTIRMPSDLLVPVVQVVHLDPADRDGKSPDHYKSSDVPTGHRAPTARGLNKLATAAGVSFYDERRTDDGSDPNVMGVTVMAELLLPTGQKIRAPGSQLIDLRTWFGSQTSDAEKAKFRKQFFAHVSTRAKNRATRGVLSLRSSYPDRDIAKPFAVVSFAPNMNHPAVRERMLDVMVGASAALYGPAPAAQLAAGEPVTTLPEAEDDAPVEDEARDVTPSEDGDEPAWMRQAPAAVATTAPAEAAAVDLATRIRDTAAASGMRGGAKDPQIETLRGIFRVVGGRATTAGLQVIWPGLNVDELAGAQAQAIINVARQYETDEAFAAEWRAMAGVEQAA